MISRDKLLKYSSENLTMIMHREYALGIRNEFRSIKTDEYLQQNGDTRFRLNGTGRTVQG